MCGICGVVQLRGEPRPVIEPERLDWMTDSMTHRGPNDRGTYLADGIALGVRRLSIVDVEGGHQPVLQRGRAGLGGSERRALQPPGHPRAPERQGPPVRDALRHGGDPAPLRGRGEHASRSICAGCSASPSGTRASGERWSRATGSGIKPMYYAEAGDVLVFASELKSLLASGLVGTELDYEAIDAYLDARVRSRPPDTARRGAEADARARPRGRSGRCARGAVLVVPRAGGRGDEPGRGG